MREKQIEVFEDIVNVQYLVQGLASYVQNDFSRLLEDGIFTKEQLKDELTSMDKSYDATIEDLERLRKESREVIEYYIAK